LDRINIGDNAMKITLGPDAQRIIEARMKTGAYAKPEDVVLAALQSLAGEPAGEAFAPGEMDELLAVANDQIDRGDVLDGEQVLLELRELRNRSRSKAG
jgi:antitoxin ParD1/3/4